MRDQVPRVSFYPVVHLLTGPPGLTRNGGVWKGIKAGIRGIGEPSRVMVQALHFTAYDLSDRAWESWFAPWYGGVRIQRELAELLGPDCDVLIDSGGFQVLHKDKIDLSRWGMDPSAESVLELQLKFGPSRVASFDSPIPRNASTRQARRHISVSVRNAAWLAHAVAGVEPTLTAYLVLHGRSAEEVTWCARKLEESLSPHTLDSPSLGIALGSQVSLAREPRRILRNGKALLAWMNRVTAPQTPLHIFGVGEPVIGELLRDRTCHRPISFDNSTYVQAAFRKRVFDPETGFYSDFNPRTGINCGCPGCGLLNAMGVETVAELLMSPPYRPHWDGNRRTNRSDLWAALALHNLRWWRARLSTRLPVARAIAARHASPSPATSSAGENYVFPLKGFEPRADGLLLLLPCSRGRPYARSAFHRRILSHLESDGWIEGDDFDRITLSGLYGPVHWNHENHPAIMSYDFPLTKAIHPRHTEFLRIRTATVLGVIGKRYGGLVAYLQPRLYGTTFGPVVQDFDAQVVERPHDICVRLDTS